MIDEIDAIGLQADLAHSHCQLNHGPRDTAPHRAVDYLILPVGRKDTEGRVSEAADLVIPICSACLAALNDEAWTLLYCLDCNQSQWILRELAKMDYRHHLIWLKGCPKCSTRFGGIFFSDPQPLCRELLSRRVA
ncbi:MAG: hypothetical protein C0613_06825 [Desulfobulbaceae bacterium]|nr:MAG: hypothetical protein C0613_06825 [Desulfobulbaceae bacterium]